MNVFAEMVRCYVKVFINRKRMLTAAPGVQIMKQRYVVDMGVYLYIQPTQVRYTKQSQKITFNIVCLYMYCVDNPINKRGRIGIPLTRFDPATFPFLWQTRTWIFPRSYIFVFNELR
jgi:hypothetical protein